MTLLMARVGGDMADFWAAFPPSAGYEAPDDDDDDVYDSRP